jgi:hypothetical protein
MIAAALNNSGQAVGNGFLYSNGSVQALLSLVPTSGGWSNLNATGINDFGQIVGQGTYDGQLQAFEMTPENVPEPGALAVWTLGAAAAGFYIAVPWRRSESARPAFTVSLVERVICALARFTSERLLAGALIVA